MKWFKKTELITNGNNSNVPVKITLVSDYLAEKSVRFFSKSVSKEEILFKLVSSLSLPDHVLALNAVLEREKMGGTIIDATVSIPHARLNGLKTIELSVGICNDPFQAKDQFRLYFLFLSPRENTKIHLLFLSSLSALLQSEGFMDQMADLKAPHEVVHMIRQIEKGI